MTSTSLAAILGTISLFATSMSVSAQAPAAPAPASAEALKSTSELTLSVLSHFQKVFSAAASATDKTTAEKAVATIASELKQVDALSPLLAASKKPTQAEMEAVAEASAKMEFQMRKQIEAIARNSKNKDVRALIDPAMKQFAAKTSSARAAMDKLYPPKQMELLVKAAKARIELEKSQ